MILFSVKLVIRAYTDYSSSFVICDLQFAFKIAIVFAQENFSPRNPLSLSYERIHRLSH